MITTTLHPTQLCALSLSVVLAIPGVALGAGGVVSIDFGPCWGAPSTVVELTDQLEDLGVVFSSTSPQGVLWHGTDPPVGSFPYCISPGWDGPYGATDPVRVDFDPVVVNVSVRAFDGGGDVETVTLSAFDSNDELVDLAQLTGTFHYPGNVLTVTGDSIAYVTFGVTGTISGVFYDDLSYATENASCLADLDGDQIVGTTDLCILLAAWHDPGPGDLNGDGIVNVGDLLQLLAAWGACPWTLSFEWPMPGEDAHDWVINNYVDLDDGSGVLDYMGGSKTLDGHDGIDIDVPNFRYMDNDFPIIAAASGTVIATDDSQFDRNTSCVTTPWNYVTVELPNGWRTTYGHFKQDSVVVQVGDSVAVGQILGVVGSSGCSTTPHLHFEVRDENGDLHDPFLEELWISPPPYDTPLGFMDAVLTDVFISNLDVVKDPPPNVEIITTGQLGVGLSMAGGQPGDDITIEIRDANGQPHGDEVISFTEASRHTFWYRNFTIDGPAGIWTVRILLNDQLEVQYSLNVQSSPSGQEIRLAVPESQYQAEFDELVGLGYRLRWIDGYDFNGSTFFNAIFDLGGSAAWEAAHGLTGSEYQDLFDALTSQGYRLEHVDSYLSGGLVRYAALFIQQGGSAWWAYHGLTNEEHQAQFDQLVAQGYRPKVISPLEVGGTLYVTALYDGDDVGAFFAAHGLSESDYQIVFEEQVAAGRALAYIEGYVDNGQARLSGIWNAVVPATWWASHGRSQTEFEQDLAGWVQQGLLVRAITAYQDGGSVNFGGMASSE